jgi:predicted nucleic acid-binding protein
VIVLDASAAIDLLTFRRRWREIQETVIGAAVAVPGHWRIECISALRRLERADAAQGLLDRARAGAYEDAVRDLDSLMVTVHPVSAQELWDRRTSLRVSDAAYVSLARALGATLVTSDGRLARARELDCQIRSFEPI